MASGGSIKMFASIGGILFLNSFVDFKDPMQVWVFRGLFVVVAGATYLAWQYIHAQVEANKEANERTPVWVKKTPGLMDMFTGGGGGAAGGAAPEYQKTTIYAIESAACAKGAPLMGMVFPLVMSFQMNIHLPLGMQVITTPVNAFEDPVLKKYLLGSKEGYGELLADPTGGAATDADAAQRIAGEGTPAVSDASAVAGGVAVKKPSASGGSSAADVQSEEAVLSVWESTELVDIAVFEALSSAGKDVNFRVPSNGWAALHVVAGNPQYTVADVRRLLALGADPLVVDVDAWTPLHWAAFHNSPQAVEAICGSYAGGPLKHRRIGGLDDLREVLKARDSKGRTPFDVAVEEGNTGVADALRAAAVGAGLASGSSASQQRARSQSKEEGKSAEAEAETEAVVHAESEEAEPHTAGGAEEEPSPAAPTASMRKRPARA